MRHILLLSLAISIAVAADPEPREPTLKEAQAAFAIADQELNETWAAVKKALTPAEFAMLKEEQRGWAEWRDHIALSPTRSNVSGHEKEARKSPEYFTAAADITNDRAVWLNALMTQSKSPDDSLTGHWSDSYNGEIDIVEKDGHLHFSINVVRGRGANIGDLSGIAVWNHSIGWFSDKGRDKDKKDEANLAFILRGPKLEIIEANADDYHGHNAFFNGEYVKVGDLDAKRKAEVLQEAKTGEVPK